MVAIFALCCSPNSKRACLAVERFLSQSDSDGDPYVSIRISSLSLAHLELSRLHPLTIDDLKFRNFAGMMPDDASAVESNAHGDPISVPFFDGRMHPRDGFRCLVQVDRETEDSPPDDTSIF